MACQWDLSIKNYGLICERIFVSAIERCSCKKKKKEEIVENRFLYHKENEYNSKRKWISFMTYMISFFWYKLNEHLFIYISIFLRTITTLSDASLESPPIVPSMVLYYLNLITYQCHVPSKNDPSYVIRWIWKGISKNVTKWKMMRHSNIILPY